MMGEDALFSGSVSAATPRMITQALQSFLYMDHPWTEQLEGQRVLVVHPFADSIIDQYDEHREEIWPGTRILPEFADMEVVETPMTIGGKGDDEDWGDTLDTLKDTISDSDCDEGFDVALIGCGGYGLPLAAHVRVLGKKAIHLGGTLQLLFGIKGHQWDDRNQIKRFYNDAWIRPADSERPDDYEKVERGGYW